MNSNSSKSSVRPLGQRSIISSFRASNLSTDLKKDVEWKASSQKGSRSSLSDFLSRRLHRSSVLPTSLQGKEVPFSCPLSVEESSKRGVGGRGENEKEARTKISIDGIFRVLKDVERDVKDPKDRHSSHQTPLFDEDALNQTRKRKKLLDANEDKPSSRKVLAVLGEDSKPRQCTDRKRVSMKQEPRPLFNHYENGGGWWDEGMEGVDNEEVGSSDVWEGVGCTTLGGIEWH